MAVEFALLQSRIHLGQSDTTYVRTDGRGLFERRPTALNIGSISTADGSALVKLGLTTVVCGIKAELANPLPEEPNKGFVVPNVDLPPLCSSVFKPGPPSEQAQVLSQFVNDVLKNSDCLPLDKLCIVEGQLSWCLYIDLTCLDFDGNLPEACILAACSALKNLTLPKVDSEEGNINVLMDREAVPVEGVPLAITFAALDDSRLIVDPTFEEENISKEVFTVVLKENDDICCVHKPGGSFITQEQIDQCIKVSKELVKEPRLILSKALTNLDMCS